MRKSAVARTWLIGLAIIFGGIAVASIATVVWLAHVVSVTADGSTYQPDSSFWTAVVFWWSAGLAAVAGIVVQMAAWIGAVMNAGRLADRTWFHVLLWLGIAGLATSPVFGLGAVIWWGVTIAYIIAGPDTTAGAPAVAPAAPPTLAPTV